MIGYCDSCNKKPKPELFPDRKHMKSMENR